GTGQRARGGGTARARRLGGVRVRGRADAAFGRRPPGPSHRCHRPAGRGGRCPSGAPRGGAELGRDRVRHAAEEAGVIRSGPVGHGRLTSSDALRGARRAASAPGVLPVLAVVCRVEDYCGSGLLRVRITAGRDYCGSGPTATGRRESDDHSDHEPTYSAAGMPATASARTSCAPETPEPQYTPTGTSAVTPSSLNRAPSSPAGRKRPSGPTFCVVGAETAPGMCPAT